MLSEDQGPDIIKDAAMIRMQKLAQKIYDTTPGINTRKSFFDILWVPLLLVCSILTLQIEYQISQKSSPKF